MFMLLSNSSVVQAKVFFEINLFISLCISVSVENKTNMWFALLQGLIPEHQNIKIFSEEFIWLVTFTHAY